MFRSLLPFSGRGSTLARETDSPFYSLQRDVNRAFDEMYRSMLGVPAQAGAVPAAAWAPDLDMKETENEVVLSVDLPGMEEKDVEIALRDDVLTIRGERKAEKTEKNENWQVVERSYGSFYRAVTLPFEPDAGKAQANFEKGVLTIRIPKSAEAKTTERKIPIAKK
jgi:HSP20 family protein